jgi:hypothetical protein
MIQGKCESVHPLLGEDVEIMREHYKVLGAALALGEFTVAGAARLSGVKENTVRTVINRERELFADAGFEPTGEPGGQHRKYRLKAERRAALRSRLEGLYDELRIMPASPSQSADSESVPAALFVAEDVLLRRLPLAANQAERQGLIGLATAALRKGEREAGELLEHETRFELRDQVTAHLSASRALLAVCSHSATENAITPDFETERLRAVLYDVAQTFARLGDTERVMLLLHHTGSSETPPLRPDPVEMHLVLMDGIPTQDETTPWVHNVLRERVHHFNFMEEPPEDIGQLNANFLVVTFDSRAQQNRALSLCREVSSRYGGRACFLDLGFSHEVREQALALKSNYVNDVSPTRMSVPALLSALRWFA